MVSSATQAKDTKLFELIAQMANCSNFLDGIPIDYLFAEIKRQGVYIYSSSLKVALKRLEAKGDIRIDQSRFRVLMGSVKDV